MKTLYTLLILLLLTGSIYAQVGINSDGTNPDNSAMLDVKSTEKGFLPPRMTSAQMIAVASPAAGLMVFNTTLNKMVYYNGSSWKRADELPLYYIGMNYGGGIIFYIDETQQHGMIVSPIDVVDDNGAKWGCDGFIMPSNSTAFGTGQVNTTAIVNNGCFLTPVNAATICNDLILNGYDDWFVPSKDELSEIYAHKAEIGGFTAFQTSYWSSSQINEWDGWVQNFANGVQASSWKAIPYNIRAVRVF